MSVYENIRYPLKVRKVPKSEHEHLVRKTAVKVELGNLLNRRPRELSGGQRQRVALARAIVRAPTVFLMDEPLSNLDAKLRVNMRAELKHLQHELRITTIYVTHDQIEAMTLADRVAVMDNGIISQLDTPERIYNDPDNLFVAGFIGSPSMNLLEGSMEDGKFMHSGFSVKAGFGSNQDVTLGIRPEDLELTSAENADCSGRVYSFELTGESTLVTLQLADDRLTIRGSNEYRVAIDETVGIRFNLEKCYLFDSESKQRIRS